MTFEWRRRLGRGSLPSLAALLTLGTAVGVACLPQPAVHALRGGLEVLLAPGQRGVAYLTEQAAAAIAPARAGWGQRRSLDQLTRALADAELQNRRLRQELSGLRTAWATHAAEASATKTTAPHTTTTVEPALLSAQVVRVRVLGSYARAWLADEALLDGGTNEQFTAAALVLDDPWPKSAKQSTIATPASAAALLSREDRGGACLDHATDIGLASGQLVLSARGVWGQLTRVGPWTSHARSLCDPQSRLLVQTIDPRSHPPRLGPQGLWCGAGAGQGRILHVDLTAPVAVNDLVVAAGWEGILDLPPLVGTITHVTRDTTSGEWHIEAQATCAAEVPRYLSVLRTEWNPARQAETAGATVARTATAAQR